MEKLREKVNFEFSSFVNRLGLLEDAFSTGCILTEEDYKELVYSRLEFLIFTLNIILKEERGR